MKKLFALVAVAALAISSPAIAYDPDPPGPVETCDFLPASDPCHNPPPPPPPPCESPFWPGCLPEPI